MIRAAWAEIDLSAIAHNARVLAGLAAPARLCAVVKAGGYGHGSVRVAETALQHGASHLAVALVEEGVELRRAGITAPILLLSQPPPDVMAEVVSWSLTPTIYSSCALDALCSALPPSPAPYPVHVKVDTGMHRVGAAAGLAVQLARRAAGDSRLRLEGFWTHFAVSDEPADPFTSTQIRRFEEALAELAAAGVEPEVRHAANSGGLLWHAGASFDMVRTGIALYGLAPGRPAGAAPLPALRPAMSLRARVSLAKTLAGGERVSYGRRYELPAESVVATVPLGYADGVPRRLFECGGEVLIGGRRRPIAGTVTMDQILVDCGPDDPVAAGDEVVLIGRQGAEEITAWEWAERLGTIAYEIVCGISGRIPRRYTGS